jgi:hypothetical protein
MINIIETGNLLTIVYTISHANRPRLWALLGRYTGSATLWTGIANEKYRERYCVVVPLDIDIAPLHNIQNSNIIVSPCKSSSAWVKDSIDAYRMILSQEYARVTCSNFISGNVNICTLYRRMPTMNIGE